MNYDVQHIISINVVVYVGIFIYSQLKMDTLLSLYNPFDPFFNFLQFISYMFIHSIHLFLHITFNMFILWIWGIHRQKIFEPLKFLIIYFSSGVTAGLLQNILNILIIYYYTGILDLYKISHGRLLHQYNSFNLQYAMYTPIIGSSGAISSIVFTTRKHFLLPIEVRKIFIINFILYNVLVFFKIFPGISHLSHISGAITGYYISQSLKM